MSSVLNSSVATTQWDPSESTSVWPKAIPTQLMMPLMSPVGGSDASQAAKAWSSAASVCGAGEMLEKVGGVLKLGLHPEDLIRI